MSDTYDRLLDRFVAQICVYQALHTRVGDAERVLAEFNKDGLVVAEGEREFVAELRTLLEGAMRTPTALHAEFADGRQPKPGTLAPIVAAMTQALADQRWELLAEITATLHEKKALQDGEVQRMREILKRFGEGRDRLKVALDQAGGAAVIPELNYFAEIDRLHDRLNNAVSARLASASPEVEALQQMMDGLAERERDVLAKTAQAAEIRKRADLVLLRSPLGRHDLYDYQALLRTASEPGVPGVSLHASSTLVQGDRDELREMMAQVTRNIRAGGLRSDGPGIREVAPFGGAASHPVIEEVSLQSTGEFMYRLLMPEPVKRYFEAARCSLTLTTNDLELPWELMHDGVDFLCLRRPMARMPMGTYVPPERPVKAREGKPRFLLIHPSADLPGAAEEVRHIRCELEQSKDVRVDVLDPGTATGRELNRLLMYGNYDVIHYAGHAWFDRDDPDQSGLLLKDGELFLAEKAQRLLSGAPLVFLNACESGATAGTNDGAANYYQAPAAGLASAFVHGGALGCVGAVWPVYDDGAAGLAIALYRHFLAGARLGEALRLARLDNRKTYPAQYTWAAFVLYGDPTFQRPR